MPASSAIRVGIGGWTYAPWRGTFYPADLPHVRELEYAGQHLTAIEINGTFYRTQSAASFAKWRDETPDGFVFSVKGHRAVVNSKKLAEAGEAIDWFLKSGILELGDKLGPILWQLAPFKRFDAKDLAGFFALLPDERGGQKLRHVLEVRHESFKDAAFVALARERGVAIAYADSDEHPAISDLTADFVYGRLQRSRESEPAGYSAAELDLWARRAKEWAAGGQPADLPSIEPPKQAAGRKGPNRDVFLFFIAGDKVRAPAAAQALISRLPDGKPKSSRGKVTG